MIEEYFNNEILLKRKEETVYEDWISKRVYAEEVTIPCRVCNLNYRDLQLLQKTADIQNNTKKLFTEKDVEIWVKDLVIFENKEYKVVAEYNPQNKTEIHHKKFYIQMIA